jgi:hypothetical protein
MDAGSNPIRSDPNPQMESVAIRSQWQPTNPMAMEEIDRSIIF